MRSVAFSRVFAALAAFVLSTAMAAGQVPASPSGVHVSQISASTIPGNVLVTVRWTYSGTGVNGFDIAHLGLAGVHGVARCPETPSGHALVSLGDPGPVRFRCPSPCVILPPNTPRILGAFG